MRHAVVHRGFDPAASGHADGTIVKVLCPAKVYNQCGNTSYTCAFQYTVELADHCNQVVNPAIFEVLDRRGFLDPKQHLVSKEETVEAIRNTREMPDWAKAMAQKAVGEMDFDRIAIEIAATRVKQMKTFLGYQFRLEGHFP